MLFTCDLWPLVAVARGCLRFAWSAEGASDVLLDIGFFSAVDLFDLLKDLLYAFGVISVFPFDSTLSISSCWEWISILV